VTDIGKAGTFRLGDRDVKRMGYGAMQLAGPGVFGPPKDRNAAIAVLREAVDSGVDHVDTSDYYGPHVVNELIREALWPFDGLTIVTKLGARRGDDASWITAFEPDELVEGLQGDLRNLGVDVIDVANLRSPGNMLAPAEGSIARQVEALAGLQRQGLLGHIGLSNVTARQVAEAQTIAPIVCVQNHYNFVHRDDDALIELLVEQGIAFVPFFPLGGMSPLQSEALSAIAAELGATAMQVALAWLLRRSPNILLIPGTSSLAHLRENLAAAELVLPDDAVALLESIDRAVG
jgi:pyridoxine 4-dehydrogenase